MIDQFNGSPNLEYFKKEAGEVNTLLSQQNFLFCQNLRKKNDLCKTSDSLMNHLSDMRTYFDEIEESIYE